MVHINRTCMENHLENCKIQVYKIDNNITTWSRKRDNFFHSSNKIKHFDLILHF